VIRTQSPSAADNNSKNTELDDLEISGAGGGGGGGDDSDPGSPVGGANSGGGTAAKIKRRLARKAELARASRQRMKAYVSDLEEKLSVLNNKVTSLEQQLTAQQQQFTAQLAAQRTSAAASAAIAATSTFPLLSTSSNHSGGVQAGLSNGACIVLRVAFKPPATIGTAQRTVDFYGTPITLAAGGRHDPCVVPRAVPIVEAMTALVLADVALQHEAQLAASAPYPLIPSLLLSS
jgi:hypothetical protein